MHVDLSNSVSATGLRVGLVVSAYHAAITGALRDGAVQAFRAAGGRERDLIIAEAPGAFELTALSRAMAHRGDLDAVVALGCIITGQTPHDRYLAQAVAHGLTAITVQTGVPVAFGVLTCANLGQARARAGGSKGNKGAEAMAAAMSAAQSVCALVGNRRRRSAPAGRNGVARRGTAARSRGRA